MKNLILIAAATSVLSALAGAQPWRVFNEDNDRWFCTAKASEVNEAGLRTYIDGIADSAKPTHIFFCPCGQRASFDSKAWEPIWMGLNDPDANGKTNHPWCVNAKRLFDQGVDPYRVWIDQSRKRGISPWLSMRVNDDHVTIIPNYFRLEKFWRVHPELRKRPDLDPWDPASPKGWNLYSYDYSHPEVREHQFAMFKELVWRYDADGIELDWLRTPGVFNAGKGKDGIQIITDFMRRCRQEADIAGNARGRPFHLAVRLPVLESACLSYGFDPVAWAREKLADVFTFSDCGGTADFDIDADGWRATLEKANPNIRVLVGTDTSYACSQKSKFRALQLDDLSVLRGWLARYAEVPGGLYFFNSAYMPPASRRLMYADSLDESKLNRGERRFPLTFHDAIGSGIDSRPYRILPRSVANLQDLTVNAVPGACDSVVEVVLGFDREVPDAGVSLNGAVALGASEVRPERSRYSELSHCVRVWRFNPRVLAKGANKVRLLEWKECAAVLVWCEIAVRSGEGENPNRIKPLANDFTVVCRSPNPTNIYCYTPGICRLASGRLIATCDFGGRGLKSNEPSGHIFVSDDHGVNWRKTGDFPLVHARPFVAGGRLYVLGHKGNLGVLASDNEGLTWSSTAMLTQGECWHQSACNVWHTRGHVYLVMERFANSPTGEFSGWGVNRLCPVVMRGKEGDDLTKRENWKFAESSCFDDFFLDGPAHRFEGFGIPWYRPITDFGMRNWGDRKRLPNGLPTASPTGWLETNIVQIMDPDDVWYDPSNRTFHLFMRTNTSGSGYAAIAKVVEKEDGSMKLTLEQAPSGVKTLFVPFPGGQMRFHVLWDEETRLYWLLSTQATDTMCRHDRMPKDRYNLPYDERQRMQLSFSKNMHDWCFAGFVAAGKTVKESRHYASMAIDGDDLVILSRSGTTQAMSPHNGDMITFHRIRNFRSLVY